MNTYWKEEMEYISLPPDEKYDYADLLIKASQHNKYLVIDIQEGHLLGIQVISEQEAREQLTNCIPARELVVQFKLDHLL